MLVQGVAWVVLIYSRSIAAVISVVGLRCVDAFWVVTMKRTKLVRYIFTFPLEGQLVDISLALFSRPKAEMA